MAKIIIGDDDPKARTLLVDLLDYEGHVVIQCDNAADGLKVAERKNPDLAISDSRTPGMSGAQCPAKLMLGKITAVLNSALRQPFPAHPETLRAQIPAYLASCREDAAAVERALAAGDLAGIQAVGHNLKGTGSACGLSPITKSGHRLEFAAKACDRTEIAERWRDLGSYLSVIKGAGAQRASGDRPPC